MRFHEGQESIELKEDYLKNNDLLKLFFEYKHYTITHNKKDYVFKDNLYTAFKKFCDDLRL